MVFLLSTFKIDFVAWFLQWSKSKSVIFFLSKNPELICTISGLSRFVLYVGRSYLICGSQRAHWSYDRWIKWWGRKKKKIGFKKKDIGFDDLEKDDGGPENHEKSVTNLW